MQSKNTKHLNGDFAYGIELRKLRWSNPPGNKEFIIWATVSSWSCFCWLYRASPSLAAKNMINLISVLTIWSCPCIESPLVLLESLFAMASAFSWQNSISLCPASFRIPRPNLPVTLGVSWLSTFTFQSPIMKRKYAFGPLAVPRRGIVCFFNL